VEFTAAAEKYDRFMGRYTRTLAPTFADAAGVSDGMSVLDVGCGPGGLTDTLADRVGERHVAAIDPAPQFVAACRTRHPAADVRLGMAEELPWADGSFDATLSCLVIAFMNDADQGVREMTRVTRPGGTVAACMWDIAGGGMTMLNTFWKAARQLDPSAAGEQARPGVRRGDIADRLRRAGLQDVKAGELEASANYASFEDFWQPLTFAVGPAGQYLAALSTERQNRVREGCRAALPERSSSLTARAWYARGTAPE
jgi:ubiquinone/menaquinone biosynthesis C-methylase UbiE